jgi:hypothetical protein
MSAAVMATRSTDSADAGAVKPAAAMAANAAKAADLKRPRILSAVIVLSPVSGCAGVPETILQRPCQPQRPRRNGRAEIAVTNCKISKIKAF